MLCVAIYKAGSLFLPPLFSCMATLYSAAQIERILADLNKRFNCAIALEEFHDRSYSDSSLSDMLIQRISDELSGEWTTEKAYAVLRRGLITMGVSEKAISMESPLDVLIPREGRRAQVAKWSEHTGLELDVLKPNTILHGALVLMFFIFIPLGFGMDWFVSGVGMLVCAGGIFLLGKNARHFKMKTLGQMAEKIAWSLYLKQQKGMSHVSQQSIAEEVKRALSKA
jgi:hypothetical protein